MPIPKPKLNEKEEDFMNRCMNDSVMVTEYKDGKQRSAVCYTSWKDSEKSANLADIKELFNKDYTEIKDVEILNTFENAHKIKFTDKDLQDIVDNYTDLKISGDLIPNVKISHSDQQLILKEYFKMNDVELGEELPNLGLLDNIRIVDGVIKTDIVKIPKVLSDIYKGAYSSISPEIIMNWKGEGRKVIRGIVLTNNPSQKHISDVHLSAGPLYYDGNPIFLKGGNMGAEDKIKVDEVLKDEGFIAKLSDKISTLLKGSKDEVKKPAEALKDNFVKLSTAQFEEINQKINDLSKKVIEKEDEAIKFSASLQSMKEVTKKETADAICSKALTNGVPKVVIDKLKPLLLSDIEISEKGEQIVKLSRMVDEKEVIAEVSITEIVKDFFNNYPGERIDFSDKTVTELAAPSDDKMKKVNVRVSELEKTGMSRHAALSKAGEELL